MGKARLDRLGLLKENIKVDQEIINEVVAHLNAVTTDFSEAMEEDIEVDADQKKLEDDCPL